MLCGIAEFTTAFAVETAKEAARVGIDGVMVMPQSRAAEMANRAADVLEAENRIRQEIRDNKTTLAKVVNLSRWEMKSTDAVG